MNLKLMDYKKRRKTFEIPDDVQNIDITLMYGDEVAEVTMADGKIEIFDACDYPRTADRVEGKYNLYRTGDEWPNKKWEHRKSSYDGQKIKETQNGNNHDKKP